MKDYDQAFRLLVGVETYPPDVNGAAVFARQLAAGLARRGHEVHVITPTAEPLHTPGVVVHRVPSVRVPIHPSFRIGLPLATPRRVLRIVEEFHPNIVHVHSHFLVGRSLLSQARRRDLPRIATNHFMPENLLGYVPIRGWVRSWATDAGWSHLAKIFNNAQRLTTPTPTAAAMLMRTGVRVPVQVVSCGTELARFAEIQPGHRRPGALGLPDLPTVCFVGRLDPEKHLEEPLRALALLEPKTQLVLTGTGTRYHQLRSLALQLGVVNRVHFLGRVPDDQLPDVYAGADVIVMPGRAELQSLATLEAMASGRPVVAADAVALPHLVHDNVTGFLYRPGDVNHLAQLLKRLLDNASLRCNLGAAGRALAAEHGIDATVEAYEGLYNSLINTAGNPPANPR